jgi:hypothetical protein
MGDAVEVFRVGGKIVSENARVLGTADPVEKSVFPFPGVSPVQMGYPVETMTFCYCFY